ncbi:MAG: hypothetical protein N2441_07510 [Rhodocyclaceae bacterium]|nr:hypothetical protein [Rhodocyclaceae bacterium]
MERKSLLSALACAMAGDWHQAHRLVQQDEHDPLACWIHAVLHKIEGDAWNSRYWYARSQGRRYEDYADAQAELLAIRAMLEGSD